MSARRRSRTADSGGNPLPGGPYTLPPEDDDVAVGDGVAQAAKPTPKPRTRVPFGSYLPPDLQREYKARCVLLGIEMQDALEQAIRDWLDKNPA